ncbi:hypothetical protein WJX73_001180 [Symbiochloris irregularis]|uniref:Coenzyme Q-binding protein COQ10 START domain-containing protein n=1 Tax=Symbiochloris irregularis TaxID=706552 RepID=A0AAW1P2B8_9CHLO
MAPVESVWGALTDYESLGNFIPGLAENRCLSRNPKGARLLQVGEQNVALGAKFRAKVILDIQEYYDGVPMNDCCIGKLGLTDGKYPLPRGLAKAPAHDIVFRMVEGDFQDFQGVWRMQQRREQEPTSTYLSYAVYVAQMRPQDKRS